jgi:hypothetical protein
MSAPDSVRQLVENIDANTEKKPLYLNIFTFASHYSQGASFLESNVLKNGALIPSYVLCSSFCVELLLKCLLLIRHDDVFTRAEAFKKNIKLDGHSYSQLFEQIDSEIQEKILLTYKKLFSESITKQGYANLLKKFGDKGFIEWRYVYESKEFKTFDPQLLHKISESLAKCIELVLEEKSKRPK